MLEIFFRRKQKELSQEEVAKLLELSRSYYATIEREPNKLNSVSFKTVCKLCEILEFSLDEIKKFIENS